MTEPAVVRIFDTTLRDGEQSPGATMTTGEKIQVAQQLVQLNVDIIEAGFPAASPGDLLAVKEIARTTGGYDVAIAGLARASVSDIDAAWEAVCDAERPVIHVFLATSDIHLKHKFKIDREEALHRVKTMVKYARDLCPTIEFSAEDATRSDWDYLCLVFETAIKSGATTINVPDTVGYTSPQEYEALFQYLRNRVPGIEEVVLSAHCHNDLGMATANTLAAIKAGARQVEVTINGLGERAGYEIMTPQSVGWLNTKLVMGKHSGRHGLDARLRQLGHKLDAEQLKVAYSRFIALADQKKHITDADLLYIVESGMETPAAV